jgi:L-aspartate-alpha-decarboxylase
MKKYNYCPLCRSTLVKRKKEGVLRAFCPECDWTDYANPLPSVAALVQNPAGEILLIKRGVAPGKGSWALPTGFIEQHEDPETAVLRELHEETGVHGAVKRFIGVYTEKTALYGNVLLLGYEISLISGRPRAGSDTTQARFFPVKKMPKIFFRSHRAVIHDHLNTRAAVYIEVLKSKITEATVTHTHLYYKGSMGIDSRIMEAANILPGEKVHVLNYNNGERMETYTIAEKAGSRKFILYGPASHKGKVGDRLCILSYAMVNAENADAITPSVITLNERNQLKRKPT